jgi:hypothetical protein
VLIAKAVSQHRNPVAEKIAKVTRGVAQKPGWEERTPLQIAGEAYLVGGVDKVIDFTKKMIKSTPTVKLTRDQRTGETREERAAEWDTPLLIKPIDESVIDQVDYETMRYPDDRRALMKAQEYTHKKALSGEIWKVRGNAMNPELYLQTKGVQNSIVSSGATPFNENGKVPVAMFDPTALSNLHASVHRQVGSIAIRPDLAVLRDFETRVVRPAMKHIKAKFDEAAKEIDYAATDYITFAQHFPSKSKQMKYAREFA